MKQQTKDMIEKKAREYYFKTTEYTFAEDSRNDKVLRWHSMVHEIAHLIETCNFTQVKNVLAKIDNEMHDYSYKHQNVEYVNFAIKCENYGELQEFLEWRKSKQTQPLPSPQNK